MKPILILLGTFACICANAQSQMVVSAAGDSYISDAGSLDWTLGEIAVETYKQTRGYLTQGFHQSFSQEGAITSIQVYPNPAQTAIFIKTTHNSSVSFELADIYGKRLAYRSLVPLALSSPYEFNLENLVPAIYLLTVQEDETGQIHVYKIIKL